MDKKLSKGSREGRADYDAAQIDNAGLEYSNFEHSKPPDEDKMTWLKVGNASSGDACPECNEGRLFTRNSRRTGDRRQVAWLWCPCCTHVEKAIVSRAGLRAPHKKWCSVGGKSSGNTGRPGKLI